MHALFSGCLVSVSSIFIARSGQAVGFRASQFLEKVGVLDGGRDLVIAAGPFAEVEQAAAVGAKGEILVRGQDDFAAGWAEESFRHGVNDFKSNGGVTAS